MTEQGDSATFVKVGVLAGPEFAAQIRQELGEWLRHHFLLSPERFSDVLLAVYEALANAAEFAYAGAPHPGPMHVHADFDAASCILSVTVIDEGRWRAHGNRANDVARGRGIRLMRALADRADIDSTAAGTEVRLQWDNIVQNCGSRTT